MTGKPVPRPHHRPGTLLLGLLALWALVQDGIVLRAHHHLAPQRVVAQVQAGGVALVDACALCAAAATLEPYLPAAPSILTILLFLAVAGGSFARRYDAPSSRAHIWRSRAPPGSVSIS